MKKVIIAIVVVIGLAIPATVFAATSNSTIASNIRNFCGIGINSSNLTEQQKADLNEAFNKMTALRKGTINKMVQNGSITKDQGDQLLKRIDEMIKYHTQNGYGFGMMGGYGYRTGMMNNYGNGYGSGMMGNYSYRSGMMNNGFRYGMMGR